LNVTGITTTSILNVGTGGTIITTIGIGSVGIGSTQPTSSLDVNGSLNVNGALNVSGTLTVKDFTSKQLTEVVVNNFNTTLTPTSGTLTIDTSLGSVILGDLIGTLFGNSITNWAFTNVSTANGKATTITVIIDGDTAQTYGDACSVNGTAITGGIKWAGGSTPTASNNYDIIAFTIIKDNNGTINVFGSATVNYS
ncbi:MAG: hypothetical protein EBU90_25930, partial [Proteobacteria bacterium]|nr:hypothetical protein [Pseudomonadota bacterium]